MYVWKCWNDDGGDEMYSRNITTCRRSSAVAGTETETGTEWTSRLGISKKEKVIYNGSIDLPISQWWKVRKWEGEKVRRWEGEKVRRWEEGGKRKVPFIGNVLVPRTLVRIQLAAECECQDRGSSQRRRQLLPGYLPGHYPSASLHITMDCRKMRNDANMDRQESQSCVMPCHAMPCMMRLLSGLWSLLSAHLGVGSLPSTRRSLFGVSLTSKDRLPILKSLKFVSVEDEQLSWKSHTIHIWLESGEGQSPDRRKEKDR
jgi:hypothetical protein